MSDGVPVVWLSQDAAPQGDAARALAEWARARGITLSSVEDAGAGAGIAVDLSVGERVEKELERARDAVAALDADAADRALARAEAMLRGHPELPQAAWLRAEVERAWAARLSRIEPRDEARAAEAWRVAWALDGGRVAGVGETEVPPQKRGPVTFVVSGAGAREIVVRLDGAPLEDGAREGGRITHAVSLAPAEHQLVAYADAVPVFASWISVPPGGLSTPVAIELPLGGSCSRAAFAKVARDGAGVRATGATCPRWLAAAPSDRPAAVLVARCQRDACGPLLEWRTERLGDGAPPPVPGRGRGWPGWATWTAVGFGAAAATAVTLVATGVFEARPVEQRFVAGGARVE